MRTRTYPVRDGALTGAQVWSSSKYANNWFAVISPDPSSPGGLGRAFAKRAHGDRYYYVLPDGLAWGDAVEFAADEKKGAVVRRRDRRYGVVLSVTATELCVRLFPTGARAVDTSARFKRMARRISARAPPVAPGRALPAVNPLPRGAPRRCAGCGFLGWRFVSVRLAGGELVLCECCAPHLAATLASTPVPE